MKNQKPVKYEKVEAVSIVSAKKKSFKPSLYGGFSALKSWGKRLTAFFITLFIIAAGLIISTTPANAGPIEDWTCDSYKSGMNEEYGAGRTNITPEKNITSMIGELINYSSGNQKLTGYEMYGVTGTNFSQWYSVDREDIGTVDYKFLLPNKASPSTDVPKPGGDGDAAASNGNPYWANNWMECTGLTGAFGNGIANWMLGVSELGTVLINFTYSLAVDGYKFALTPIWNVVDEVISSLNEALFLPFIVVFIMFGALWLAWVGLFKRKSTEAFQGAIWMIGATIAGIMLVATPGTIPKVADSIVGKTTEVVTSIVTEAGDKAYGDNANALCTIDGDLMYKDADERVKAGAQADADRIASDANLGVVSPASRKVQCAIWYNLVYTPWVTGQFGMAPSSNAEGAEFVVGNQADTDKPGGQWVEDNKNLFKIKMGPLTKPLPDDNVTWPLMQLNAQSDTYNIKNPASGLVSGEQYWRSASSFVAYNQLAVNENSAWSGVNPMNRITVANTSVIATGFTALLVVFFSFLIIIYQVSMLFLVLMMPFFLLVGAHPGYGRRIATRWFELIINLTIKRIIISVLLAIFLMFYSIIMSSSTVWLIQNILIAAVTIVGLMYRKKITQIFASVDLGGDKTIMAGKNGNDGRPGLIKKATGAAVGAGVAVLGAKVGLSAMKPSEALLTGAVAGVGQGGTAGPTVAPVAATGTTTGAASPAGVAGIGEGAKPDIKPNEGRRAVLPVDKIEEAQRQAAERQKREQAEAAIAQRNKEIKRIEETKKRTLRGAALSGASQGFVGGVQGATLGAAMTGHQMGDGAYDNEAQKQHDEEIQRIARENGGNGESNGSSGYSKLPKEVQSAYEETYYDEANSYADMDVNVIGDAPATPRHGSDVVNTESSEDAPRGVPTFEVKSPAQAKFVKQQQQVIKQSMINNNNLAERAKMSGALGDAARQQIQNNLINIDTAKGNLDKFRTDVVKPVSLPPRPTGTEE